MLGRFSKPLAYGDRDSFLKLIEGNRSVLIVANVTPFAVITRAANVS